MDDEEPLDEASFDDDYADKTVQSDFDPKHVRARDMKNHNVANDPAVQTMRRWVKAGNKPFKGRLSDRGEVTPEPAPAPKGRSARAQDPRLASLGKVGPK